MKRTFGLLTIGEAYPIPNFVHDLKDALAFYNPEPLSLWTPEMRKKIEKAAAIIDFDINMEHQEATSQII